MSQRWTRALLKLYPSRIRQRYGDELLELQDELRTEGKLSLPRLIAMPLPERFSFVRLASARSS